jgi:hypothetical protein
MKYLTSNKNTHLKLVFKKEYTRTINIIFYSKGVLSMACRWAQPKENVPFGSFNMSVKQLTTMAFLVYG